MRIGILSHRIEDNAISEIKKICLSQNIDVFVINPFHSNYPINLNGEKLHNLPTIDVLITRCDIDNLLSIQSDAYFRAIAYYKSLNVRIINNEKAIKNCQDKIITHQLLAEKNISTPKTFFAYSLSSILLTAKLYIGYPLIAKSIFGGRGKEVIKIENETELKAFYNCNTQHYPILIQELIDLEKDNANCVKDYRVIVGRDKQYKPKAFGHFERIAKKNEYRTNLSLGGTLKRVYSFDEKLIQLAENTLNAVYADIAGIDIGRDRKGKLYVFEVNICFDYTPNLEEFLGCNIWKNLIQDLLK